METYYKYMETIYCTACNEKVTMHGDYSFACGCEGSIELRDGGDPMPETWLGHQMDAEETEIVLRRQADNERHEDEQENVTLYEVLEGRAHIIVSPGGECLRAAVPSNFSDDPDAYDGIIISSYPEPMMPDSVEVARLSVTGEKALENWLNTNKDGWAVEVDD